MRRCGQAFRGVRDHRPDNVRFLPRGDKHCGAAGKFGTFIGKRQHRFAQATGQSQPEVAEIKCRLVERADDKPEGGKQQQLVLDEHKGGQQLPRNEIPQACHLAPESPALTKT